MALVSPCDFAKARYVEVGRLRNSWSWLVFLFGASLGLFLIPAVLLFLRSSFLPGALTTIGAIVTGPALKWIDAQRRAAVDEDEKAFTDLERVCGPVQTRIPVEVGAQQHASSRMGFGPLAGVDGLTLEDEGEVETASWYREIEEARQSAKAAKTYLVRLRGY